VLAGSHHDYHFDHDIDDDILDDILDDVDHHLDLDDDSHPLDRTVARAIPVVSRATAGRTRRATSTELSPR
jgi:hypothetical protein